jgi:hypothetical protein
VTSYEEDQIIEGSTVFNSGGLYDQHIAPVGDSRMVMPKGKSVGSKDLTNEANSYKNQKGQYF